MVSRGGRSDDAGAHQREWRPAAPGLGRASGRTCIAHADEALDAIDLDTDTAPVALKRLTTSSWQLLSQHRQLVVAGQRHLGPERMRAHHDKVVKRVRRLVARGQKAGDIRTDLPRDWLVATYYALLHAAADEVLAGRLRRTGAGNVVASTVAAALAPPDAGIRPR